jgi:putative endonuclease
MNNWTVYILRCADNSLYTGITKDLSRRLEEHNAGKGAKYTRAKGPCVVVLSRVGFSESSAKKEEARMKRLKKIEKEALIVKSG